MNILMFVVGMVLFTFFIAGQIWERKEDKKEEKEDEEMEKEAEKEEQ